MYEIADNIGGPTGVYRRSVNEVQLESLSPFAITLTVPIVAPKLNNIDAAKSFGNLDGAAATGVVPVMPGSGTVFAIPATTTVGQLYAMAPSAIDRDLVLVQNRSVATQAFYNPGVASGLLCRMNPSGAAWFRFHQSSGTWELHGRVKLNG